MNSLLHSPCFGFARRKVDLVILEVGLGGRLDATNVITPLVSVITNVSMDHEMYLGNTLKEIAGEKAGIIKKGIPVVSGVGIGETEDERTVLSVVEHFCQERSAPLFLHGRDFLVEPDRRWKLELLGHEAQGLLPAPGKDYRTDGKPEGEIPDDKYRPGPGNP